jgi:hypothetical protein
MSTACRKILVGGIVKSLWTYTRFLSATPIQDTYGIIETPENTGLVDTGDIGEVEIRMNRSTIPRRSRGCLDSTRV